MELLLGQHKILIYPIHSLISRSWILHHKFSPRVASNIKKFAPKMFLEWYSCIFSHFVNKAKKHRQRWYARMT